MSRGSIGSWAKIAMLLLLLLLIAFGWAILEVEQKESMDRHPTTHSAGPGGYKALYLWLKAQGVPLQRWERPLHTLPSEAKVLFIAEPVLIPSKEELYALGAWVRQGGSLVLAARPPNPVLERFGLEADDQATSVVAEGATHFQPGPYTAGVNTILRWQGSGLWSSRPEAVSHISQSDRSLLAVIREGKGRIIALSAPELFNNKSLRDGDHATLALNLLLCHLGKGLLLVDEYHHGYGRVGSVSQYFLRSGASALLLQGMLVMLTLWSAFGRRFGLARPIVPPERRSSMEYVRFMAQLFQKANARRLALRAMVRWIEEEAKKDLVNRDRALRSALKAARGSSQDKMLSDRRLLFCVRGLYRTLEGARRRTSTGHKS